jgi:hypothetical protein
MLRLSLLYPPLSPAKGEGLTASLILNSFSSRAVWSSWIVRQQGEVVVVEEPMESADEVLCRLDLVGSLVSMFDLLRLKRSLCGRCCVGIAWTTRLHGVRLLIKFAARSEKQGLVREEEERHLPQHFLDLWHTATYTNKRLSQILNFHEFDRSGWDEMCCEGSEEGGRGRVRGREVHT